MIALTIRFPADKSDYARVEIWRTDGATPPVACGDGTFVTSFDAPNFVDQTPYNDVIGINKAFRSYRACIYDGAGNETSTQTISNVDSGWPCGGARVGYACWYESGSTAFTSKSCDDACASRGGYDEATRTFAGSDGTLANCGAVMAALGLGNGAPATVFDGGLPLFALGCWQSSFTPGASGYWSPVAPTTSGAKSLGVKRACACKQ